MVERYRIVALLVGLVLMLVTLQFLILGISDQQEYQYYQYLGLFLSLVAEGILVSLYKASSPIVKFVIVCVSLVPALAILTVALPLLAPSHF